MSEFRGRLFLDTEVKAPQPKALDNLGLDVYARHPATRILLFTYAIDNGPEQLWDCYHEPRNPPRDLVDALRDPGVQLIAHNAQFDRVVLMHRLGFVAPYERWYCTRARAYAHGLPGDLDVLSKIFKLGDSAKKGARGKELIDLFCERGTDPDTHPVEWLEFCDYALQDITALRALYYAMPSWCFTEFEQRVYHLNQKINDRGFAVDLPLAAKMIEASERAQQSLNKRIEALTGGMILKGTQREKIKDWLTTDAFKLIDMKAETLRKALRDHESGRIQLTPEQRELIEIRLLSAKSSVAKCRTALMTAGPDSRIRHTIVYGGGGRNLRDSHKGFQPGNMPRPTPARKGPEEQLAVVEALQQGYATEIWGDETMAACADAIRGLVVAAPGHSLYCVDWSNIEGRKLAWFADEQWKLHAFRELDAGRGVDMYKLVFHRMMGTPIDEIDDFLRQQGKGTELSMGYGGGVGAYVNVANSYQLDLVELGRNAPKMLAPEYMERGRKSWAWAVQFNDTHDLPEEVYVACAALKHAWRDACPNTVQLWTDLEHCAFAAVKNPGKVFHCAKGKVQMACDTKLDWLAIRIPSGRQIMFAKPRLSVRRRFDKDGNEHPPEEVLTCLKSPTWHREYIYGGYIANAITQGGCRDILVHAMLDVEEAGYPIIMDIHDEIIAEVPDSSSLTIERMQEIMVKERDWHRGLPLATSGYVTKRYRKG